MKEQRKPGLNVKLPSKSCDDRHCPFHGSIRIRGRMFIGTVISKDTHKTAKVQWTRQYLIKKYERFEKRLSKVSVHNPRCIDAQVGDLVRIAETRPISKTKKFVILEILEK
jgi:small subunit ribosomal protein S17